MTANGRRPGSGATVNWVTHLPAPYRVPVFRALMQQWDLEIQCTEREERIGTTGSENRGEDWKHSAFPDIAFRTLRTVRLRWRGVPLYLLVGRGDARPQRRARVVLIGGWEVPAYWQTLIAARLLRQRAVGFYESPPETHRYSAGVAGWVRRRFFRSLDAVVTPGPAATRSLKAMGVLPERIHEGFNAVDVMFFHSRTRAVRGESGLDGEAGHRFLYVGQLIERKRLEALLRAFAEARNREDTLTLVGAGVLRSRLAGIASDLGVDRFVILQDAVLNEQLPDVFARHDTLVLVSEQEVWGLVVNEALAAGLRVIVSTNCGVAESVKGMQGVRTVDEALRDLASVIRTASAADRSPIESPEILPFTPQRFARVFDSAFGGGDL